MNYMQRAAYRTLIAIGVILIIAAFASVTSPSIVTTWWRAL